MTDQTALPGATIAHCPLPDCPWATVTMPGPAEHPGALADVFGWGVFAAHAASERHLENERKIREHLETHTLLEWVKALTAAQDRIKTLEAAASGKES